MRKTLILSLLFALCTLQVQANNPCYKIRLKSEEYPLFSQAVFKGIYENGGELNYEIEVQKERTGLYVHLSICNRQTAENIKARISQQVVDVISSLNSLDNIGEQDKWTLNSLKSINQKLDYALKNPARSNISQKGLLKNMNGVTVLSTLSAGDMLLTSRTQQLLTGLTGQEVMINGFQNEDGSVEVESLFKIRKNTLELFIMSQCPFGLQAVQSVATFLNSNASGSKPQLRVNYIFYKNISGYSSMHGEEELVENLVQISIRDQFPDHYLDYMLQRASDKQATWKVLAGQAGLKKPAIDQIARNIQDNRLSIIEQEYDYVANKHKVLDGSPTYIWEGSKIGNLALLPAFQNIDLSLSGECQN